MFFFLIVAALLIKRNKNSKVTPSRVPPRTKKQPQSGVLLLDMVM